MLSSKYKAKHISDVCCVAIRPVFGVSDQAGPKSTCIIAEATLNILILKPRGSVVQLFKVISERFQSHFSESALTILN